MMLAQNSRGSMSDEIPVALGELTDDERRQVYAMGSLVTYASGEEILAQGDAGDCFFIVQSGVVEVHQAGKVLATLGKGAILGEMALFHQSHRVASAVATDHSTLLRVPTDEFWPRVLNQDEAAVRLIQALGQVMMDRLQRQDLEMMRRAEERGVDTQAFKSLKNSLMADWSLKYHRIGLPGKLAIAATKPSGTSAALSIAYSPGVAEPCIAIAADPQRAFDYTSKGHLVGVITNGTAVLGLGPIGALASKPGMEGKAILLKRFADVDAFDIEVEERDPDRLIDIVCAISPTFGAINLEDIRAPECFRIERECQERLQIPVFHDDQHGTAIVAGAALLNALDLIGKSLDSVRLVFSGAGAAGFSCAQHFLRMGARVENVLMTDKDGVVYKGRTCDGYLEPLARDTSHRTLADAIEGADVFMGVSVGNVLSAAMLSSMAADPIVFAMANPTPEIDPALAMETRSDVIMGTGRSDLPNQINNVLAFPYIFRGALDARVSCVNDEMKLAATRAIAELARLPVTEDAGFDGAGLSLGRTYVVPKSFDRRLLEWVSAAVAEAAMRSGVAGKSLDIEAYRERLRGLSAHLA